MPTLSRIDVHPVKALPPVSLDRASITAVGGLAGDRAYAIVADDGGYVNGKRTDAVHRLRADVDLATNRVSLGVCGSGTEREFHLEDDRDALAAWLSDYFEVDVSLEAGPGGSQTDSAVYGDGSETGPTLVSAATLREVASWYDGIDPGEMRLRMRPNLVVEGVPAFWEDRLGVDGDAVRVGDVTLEGVEPVPRCVVPTRHPHTGEVTDGFRETFVERRAATLPEWVDPADLDEAFYKLMVITRIPPAERDGELAVGDPVRRVGATEAQ